METGFALGAGILCLCEGFPWLDKRSSKLIKAALDIKKQRLGAGGREEWRDGFCKDDAIIQQQRKGRLS